MLYKKYLKYLKENKTPLYKSLLTMPKCAVILLVALILSGAVSLAFLCAENLRQYSLIPLVIEAILCVVVYFYSENYEINNSDKNMRNYKEYYSGIYKWLQNMSISVEEDSIIEIKRRIDIKLDKIEKTKEKNRNTVERILQVIVIPFIFSIFAQIIKNESDANIIIVYGASFMIFLIALLLAFFGFYEALNLIKKNDFHKLKSFSDDLQGLLDTQFSGGLFEKI